MMFSVICFAIICKLMRDFDQCMCVSRTELESYLVTWSPLLFFWSLLHAEHGSLLMLRVADASFPWHLTHVLLLFLGGFLASSHCAQRMLKMTAGSTGLWSRGKPVYAHSSKLLRENCCTHMKGAHYYLVLHWPKTIKNHKDLWNCSCCCSSWAKLQEPQSTHANCFYTYEWL